VRERERERERKKEKVGGRKRERGKERNALYYRELGDGMEPRLRNRTADGSTDIDRVRIASSKCASAGKEEDLEF